MSDYGNQPSDQNPYGQPGGVPGQPAQAPAAYASWIQRVGAYLIDGLLVAVAMIPYYIGVGMSTSSMEVDPATGQMTGGGLSGVGLVLAILGAVLALAVFVWNTCLKQGGTGYSIGKGVVGIKLIKIETGQPIGAGMSFLRYLLHILDGLPCYLGYLWPLWDSKNQTFADKIVSTVVIQQPKS